MRKILFAVVGCFLLGMSGTAFSQKPHQPSADEIYQKIQKLGVLGNVLYLAAHPDDENTRFIGYCANEKLFNTTYLSLTRGDGGQNLVGPEIREELGIIRTQELLAARRIDGGQQRFTRANDFGYSKTPEETQKIWDKDQVLADIVWTIRKVRPDIIVCRFPPDSRGGHGHHTSSAELGLRAFNIAGDKSEFNDQTGWFGAWSPIRIVVNTGRWWNPDISAEDENVVSEDIGAYNELMGCSYNELAALSRSQHKSQGFGSTGTRGEQLEYFEHLDGEKATNSVFDGMVTDWTRVPGSQKIASLVNEVQSLFDLRSPEKSIPKLLELRKEIDQAKDLYWKEVKMDEVDEIIKDCLGLYIEAKANDHSAAHQDSVYIDFELVNRSPRYVKIVSIWSPQTGKEYSLNQSLKYNEVINRREGIVIGDELPYSQPYWLEKEGTLGMYKVDEQVQIGKPENEPAVVFDVSVEVEGQKIGYRIPLIYKWNDPVKGEQYRPFVITPPVFVNFSEQINIFSGKQERELEMLVKAGRDNFKGKLSLFAPSGWQLSAAQFDLNFEKKGEEKRFKIKITPGKRPENGKLKATVESDGFTGGYSISTIAYDHIPTQVWFPRAESQLVFIDLKKKGDRIGYLQGAGDVVPTALRNIGYQVDELTEDQITLENLKKYDAVMLGIRALNTIERIPFLIPVFHQYTEQGGTFIIQYNTSHRLKTEDFAPYPIKLSRDRVTEEDAEVTFLKPDHQVLNQPNKITKADFDGWTQERGLYFPNEWDEKYDAILSWHDEGEDPKEGSLLVAKYGKGYFVYTGISFFRVLPGGAPGAYRLIANLISLGND